MITKTRHRPLATVARAVIIGGTATACMDIGSEAIRIFTGTPPLNLNFLGRWVAGMRHGKFAHESIAKAPEEPHEHTVGIAAHYLIGIGFAGIFIPLLPSWSTNPKLIPSVLAGISTTVAPWFLMQPAFGLGVAASKTPHPINAAYRSLRAHTFYGVGLYLGAKLLTTASFRK